MRPIGIYRRKAFGYSHAEGLYFSGYGSWDVWCHLCGWTGTDPYPVSRDSAFDLAAEHLRREHPRAVTP